MSKKNLILMGLVFLAYFGLWLGSRIPMAWVLMTSSMVYVDGVPTIQFHMMEDADWPMYWLNTTDPIYREKPEVEVEITLAVLNSGGSGDLRVGCKIIDVHTGEIVKDVSDVVYVAGLKPVPVRVDLKTTLPTGRDYRFAPYTQPAHPIWAYIFS